MKRRHVMAKHGQYAVELNSGAIPPETESDRIARFQRVAQELGVIPDQIARFKELARELRGDENEATFKSALKKLADAKPPPET